MNTVKTEKSIKQRMIYTKSRFYTFFQELLIIVVSVLGGIACKFTNLHMIFKLRANFSIEALGGNELYPFREREMFPQWSVQENLKGRKNLYFAFILEALSWPSLTRHLEDGLRPPLQGKKKRKKKISYLGQNKTKKSQAKINQNKTLTLKIVDRWRTIN